MAGLSPGRTYFYCVYDWSSSAQAEQDARRENALARTGRRALEARDSTLGSVIDECIGENHPFGAVIVLDPDGHHANRGVRSLPRAGSHCRPQETLAEAVGRRSPGCMALIARVPPLGEKPIIPASTCDTDEGPRLIDDAS